MNSPHGRLQIGRRHSNKDFYCCGFLTVKARWNNSKDVLDFAEGHKTFERENVRRRALDLRQYYSFAIREHDEEYLNGRTDR